MMHSISMQAPLFHLLQQDFHSTTVASFAVLSYSFDCLMPIMTYVIPLKARLHGQQLELLNIMLKRRIHIDS